MGKEIKNVKKEINPSELAFNDRDVLEDTLISLKQLNTSLGTFKVEASNKALITIIDSLSKPLYDSMRTIFNLMFENGWYALEESEANKIDNEYNLFDTRREEMEI